FSRVWIALFQYFFFQAEDGIRDRNVTGVQTCALPILVSAVFIFIVTGFTSNQVEDPNLFFFFFAAAIAICALIMPGASGSLMLLMLGMYEPVLRAVSQLDITVILVFMAGALCGVVFIVRFLNYLLDNHRSPTLFVMTGFLLGSLR